MAQALRHAYPEHDSTIAAMAGMVCAATRQAAVDALSSALSVAKSGAPQAGDLIRADADQVLARAAIMQVEMDRFFAAIGRAKSVLARGDEGTRANAGP